MFTNKCLAKNWSKWFDLQTENMMINKKNQKVLFDSFSSEREEFECKKAMLYNPHISFYSKKTSLTLE